MHIFKADAFSHVRSNPSYPGSRQNENIFETTPAYVPWSPSVAIVVANLCLRRITPISPLSAAPQMPGGHKTLKRPPHHYHHHHHHHRHRHYYHHHAGTTHLELSLFFSDKSKLVLDFQLLASHPLQVLTQLGLVVEIVSLDGDLDDDDDDPGEW